MKSSIFLRFYWLMLMVFFLFSGFAQEAKKEGAFFGTKTAIHPDWFKESFLDLEEDIAEAAEAKKRLVVYFWQPGCPYCKQLWEDNFSHQEVVSTFRNNFEIVAINIWGDKELISVAGKYYTEKSFAEALQVKYTPTLLFEWASKLGISYLPSIIFFNQKGEEIMRIDAQMRSFHIQSTFDYVISESYKTEPNFQRYLSERADKIRKQGKDVDIWAY